jgi:hypothetical protein
MIYRTTPQASAGHTSTSTRSLRRKYGFLSRDAVMQPASEIDAAHGVEYDAVAKMLAEAKRRAGRIDVLGVGELA